MNPSEAAGTPLSENIEPRQELEPLEWNEADHTWQCNHVHAVITLNVQFPFMFEDLGNSGAHGIICAGCKCHEEGRCCLTETAHVPEWLPAAGKCQSGSEEGMECGADVQVKVEDGFGIFRCSEGHEEDDSIGWEYFDQPVMFQGRSYWGFRAVGNRSPCANCGRIVYDIPLILWGPNPGAGKTLWELHFCMECVEKIPIRLGLEKMVQ